MKKLRIEKAPDAPLVTGKEAYRVVEQTHRGREFSGPPGGGSGRNYFRASSEKIEIVSDALPDFTPAGWATLFVRGTSVTDDDSPVYIPFGFVPCVLAAVDEYNTAHADKESGLPPAKPVPKPAASSSKFPENAIGRTVRWTSVDNRRTFIVGVIEGFSPRYHQPCLSVHVTTPEGRAEWSPVIVGESLDVSISRFVEGGVPSNSPDFSLVPEAEVQTPAHPKPAPAPPPPPRPRDGVPPDDPFQGWTDGDVQAEADKRKAAWKAKGVEASAAEAWGRAVRAEESRLGEFYDKAAMVLVKRKAWRDGR